MTTLFVAHRAHLPLPDALAPIRVATSAPDLMALAAADVVVFGDPAFAVALGTLPRGALLLSWRREVVAEARDLGWRALQLPGPDQRAIARAARHPDALVEVERGTVDVGAGALWTEGGVVPLPPRELELLTALVAGERPADPAPGAVRRLRARLGRSHVATVDGAVRFRPLGPPPAPSVHRPAGASATIGGSVIDLDGLRVIHPDREVALTPREASAVARLLHAVGVVSRDDLGRAMGAPARHRRVLDLSICRLRAKLEPLELRTVRGHGYLLVRGATPTRAASPADPAVQEVVDHLAAGRSVQLTGPCGVGKSHLAARVAAALGARRIDLHGLEPARAARRIERELGAPGPVVLDGLDDAAPFADLLRSRAGWVATARAAGPVGVGISLAPWPLERLQALDPRADATLDGLPLALDPSAFGARVDALDPAVRASLDALARIPAPLTPDDGAHPALARLGWLVGTGPWRIVAPALAHLRARWTDDDHAAFGRRLLERGRAALDAVPFRRERVEAVYPEVMAAHERTGDPALAALRVDLHREIGPWDPAAVTWIARALARADDPAVRADLTYFLALGDEVLQLDLLAESAALSTGEVRSERQLELAWYYLRRGRAAEGEALLREVEATLAGLDPDAWLCVRGELAVLRGDGRPEAERVAAYGALLGRMEAARWTRSDFPPSHRRTNAARAQLARHLAHALMGLRRFGEAEVALGVALDAVDVDRSPSLLIDLADLAIRRDQWDRSDALLLRAERAAEDSAFPGWAIRALLLRALSWVFRGEPDRVDVLLERAAALPEWTRALEAHRAEVLGWCAVVAGDPAAADRATAVSAWLAAAARLVADTRAGDDPRPALARLRSAAEGIDEDRRCRLRRVLASAGVSRVDSGIDPAG